MRGHSPLDMLKLVEVGSSSSKFKTRSIRKIDIKIDKANADGEAG